MLQLSNVFLFALIFPVFVSCGQRKENTCVNPDTTIFLINSSGLDRKNMANLVNYFSNKELKVLGINIVFEGSKSDDSIFYNSLKKLDNVVLASTYREREATIVRSPFEEFNHGLKNILINDESKSVDSYYYNFQIDKIVYSSFCLELLKYVNPDKYKKFVENTDHYRINYVGNLNCFYHRNYNEIDDLEDLYWKGKVVIIGYLGSQDPIIDDTSDNIDVYKTPISKSKESMYGTIILANILCSMKRLE